MSLFNLGKITLSSGKSSEYKINCDFLTDSDIEAIAYLTSKLVGNFSSVKGVPTGGLRLARAIEKYKNPYSNWILLVDDVLTTGNSMEKLKDLSMEQDVFSGMEIKGAVIFSRGKCPDWITPLLTINKELWDQ